MTSRSDYLFATPSFAEGAGRLFDFADVLTEYNYTASGEVADAVALWCDWTAVGDDVRGALLQYIEEADDDRQGALAEALLARLGRESSVRR